MKVLHLIFFLNLALLGCKGKDPIMDDLSFVKKHFLESISLSEVEEGPFCMHYDLKTVFFSKDVISLFGKISVYEHLPHDWRRYEGKTYVKINGKFKQVFLNDLFITKNQQEFLRATCEKHLKDNSIGYFSKNNPLRTTLDLKEINTFVIDDQFLIILFQPYVVEGGEDVPLVIKISFEQLKDHWNSKNPLFKILKKTITSKAFVTVLEGDCIF